MMNEQENTALRTLLGRLCKDRMAAPGTECGDGACDECAVQAVLEMIPKPEPAREPLTAERAGQIAFQALQLIRQEARKQGRDPTDVDDWLFSELDLEAGELQTLYEPYGIPVYAQSCFQDGQSPKDYDRKHFSK